MPQILLELHFCTPFLSKELSLSLLTNSSDRYQDVSERSTLAFRSFPVPDLGYENPGDPDLHFFSLNIISTGALLALVMLD